MVVDSPCRPMATSCRSAAPPLSAWLLALAAALLIVVRAPVYVVEPSFWAEEGTLYFAVAWERSLREALLYRPAGYLLVWANLATVSSAELVRIGLLPLAHAPQVTVLYALAAQLVPVAVIACSRAAFWGGAFRRTVGVVVVLAGCRRTIWLSTVNSQPWLVPRPRSPRARRSRRFRRRRRVPRRWADAPAARAGAAFARRPGAPDAPALAQAVLAACAWQIACLWAAVRGRCRRRGRRDSISACSRLPYGCVPLVLLPSASTRRRASAVRHPQRRVGPAVGVLLFLFAPRSSPGYYAPCVPRNGSRSSAGMLVTTLTLSRSSGRRRCSYARPGRRRATSTPRACSCCSCCSGVSGAGWAGCGLPCACCCSASGSMR
jgi:hypothetical protein